MLFMNMGEEGEGVVGAICRLHYLYTFLRLREEASLFILHSDISMASTYNFVCEGVCAPFGMAV